jgi:hypothetical protein
MDCENRPQDGLIAGKYEIEVQITRRNRRSKPKKSKLKIDEIRDNADVNEI